MKKLKHFSLVGDTGYFDKEVNYAGSEALVGVKVVNIKPHVDPYVFPVCSIFLDFLHSVRSSPSVPTNKQIRLSRWSRCRFVISFSSRKTGHFFEDMMATCNRLDCWEIVLFPTGILSWLGVVGLKKTSGQKLSSGLLLTFTSPLPIPLRRY